MNLFKSLENVSKPRGRKNSYPKVMLVSLCIPLLFACSGDEPEAPAATTVSEAAVSQPESNASQIIDDAQADLTAATEQAQERIDEAVEEVQERAEVIVEQAEEKIEEVEARASTEVDSLRNRLQN